jgi:hypothetical protein
MEDLLLMKTSKYSLSYECRRSEEWGCSSSDAETYPHTFHCIVGVECGCCCLAKEDPKLFPFTSSISFNFFLDRILVPATMNGAAASAPMDYMDAGRPREARRRGSKEPPVRNSNVGNSSSNADFSSTVERILAALGQRGEDHDPHHGPLHKMELSRLSMLCTKQQQLGTNSNQGTIASTTDDKNVLLDDDLGFADVDADMMGELVEYLEKHVALASTINLIRSTHKAVQHLKSGEGGESDIEEVR